MPATFRARKGSDTFEKTTDLRELLAEREGFEPSIRFHVYTLSRRAPSTTRTPLLKESLSYTELPSWSRRGVRPSCGSSHGPIPSPLKWTFLRKLARLFIDPR